MIVKCIMHMIHFTSALLICGIAWLFCGTNKAIAIWNSVIRMDKEISDGGENEEVLN